MFGFANKQRYSKLSDQELLTNFRSENWSKIKPNDRIAILQEVENRNAATQGRTPCSVSSVNSKNEYGYYTPSNNAIKVNVNDYVKGTNGPIKNNSYQVLDTIYHEGEHAHQTNCVKNQIGPPQGLPQTTRDMCEVENSGNNYKGVISYNNCTCELDSNNAAVKKVMESKELFKDDPEYGEYMKDRERYFERAANRDMSQVHMQQSEAVYQAYQAGDIDLQKHDDILLNEVNKDQPAFEEAKEISETIKQERLQNEQNFSRSVDDEELDNQLTEENEEDLASEVNNSEDADNSEEVDNSEDESEDIEEEQGYRRR